MKPNTVGTVFLYGIRIVSLSMDGKERLCLAQISNTLLKEYSYNEIHNRRVALGITCVQCTPVQLEILRRAGAMPISSRRCGMITKREAERLCKSFLGDNAPPKLPENFAFEVFHECAWGCRGQFVPARYNSSRAKCIKCHICGVFFSPNKFVFHSHRMAESDKYVQPDAANFNSWRRHTKLLGDPPEEIVHAWEDIKAMFNGGTRKRMMSNGGSHMSSSAPGSMAEHGPFAKEMKMESEYKSKQAQEMAGSGFDQSDMGIFGRNHVPPSFPYFAPFHNLDPMALMSGSGFPNIEPKPKPETKTPSHMDAAWPSQNALRPYPGHWNPFHYPFLWPKNPFLASGHGSMDDMEGHKKAPNQEGSSTFDLNSWLEQRRHLSDEMGMSRSVAVAVAAAASAAAAGHKKDSQQQKMSLHDFPHFSAFRPVGSVANDPMPSQHSLSDFFGLRGSSRFLKSSFNSKVDGSPQASDMTAAGNALPAAQLPSAAVETGCAEVSTTVHRDDPILIERETNNNHRSKDDCETNIKREARSGSDLDTTTAVIDVEAEDEEQGLNMVKEETRSKVRSEPQDFSIVKIVSY